VTKISVIRDRKLLIVRAGDNSLVTRHGGMILSVRHGMISGRNILL
jgi:hypothetical protein